MASKKRGNLSRREYASQQKGGKLNYDTGRITVKKQTGYSKPPRGYENSGASSNEETDQLRSGVYADGTKYGVSHGAPTYSYETYETKKAEQDQSSNRQRASEKRVLGASDTNYGDIMRSGLGVNTAQASGDTIRQAPTKSWLERGLEIAKDPFGLEPKARGLLSDKPWQNGASGILGYKANPIYQVEKGLGDSISQLLNGVTPELGVSESFTDDNTGIFASPSSTPRTNNNNRPNPVQNDNRPNPVQNNNPWQAPQSSNVGGLAPSVRQLLGVNTAEASEQNNTPIMPDNGTIMRPGRGQFSTGEFSNGKGGYVLGGGGLGMQSSGGVDSMGMSEDSPWENSLFGNKQVGGYSGMGELGMGEYDGKGGFIPASQLMNSGNPYVAPRMNEDIGGGTQNVGGSQDNSPQYSGGSQNSNNNQEKLMKEKEFIKQYMKDSDIKDLLKGLTEQYGQQQTEGLGALDRNKMNDLNRQNAMFSFGNSDPNDEQRIQYNQRTADDYAGQNTDFLAKLAASRSQDILGVKRQARQQASQAYQSYQSYRENAQTRKATAEQQAWDRNYKMMSLNRGGSRTPKNDSLTPYGINAQGEPVFWNNRTRQMQTGTGLTKSLDPMTALLQGLGGNQGGQKQIQYDENGRAYYEE